MLCLKLTIMEEMVQERHSYHVAGGEGLLGWRNAVGEVTS